jgi:GNAT superfamily N-acetyltransferase
MRKPTFRAAIRAILESLIHGELTVPANVRARFPATFHFNLLPEARGLGLGSRLVEVFLRHMRSLHVPGVHVQPLSINPLVPRFLARRGFQLVESHPLHVFRHTDKRAIDLQTWVLALA